MKKLLLIIPIILFLSSCGESGGDSGATGMDISSLSTTTDSTSYGFGYSTGKQLNQPGNPLNTTLMFQGFQDVANGTAKTQEQLTTTLQAYDAEMRQRQGRPVTAEDPMNTSIDSFSYSLGAFYAYQFGDIKMDFNPAAICKGMGDALGTEAMLTETEITALNTKFYAIAEQKNQAFQAELAAKNEAEGIAFLNENKKNEGVIELPNGMQYKVLETGAGVSPTAEDQVVVHYTGRLIDGTVFDSSVERGEPATFGVGGVIAGWTFALQMMKPGDKWQLFIPSALAYGERGNGRTIPPNKTLIFDVELISITGK